MLRRTARWVGLALLCVASASAFCADTSDDEVRAIDAWRTTRLQSLTGPTGWLTLTGLFWLQPGKNSFGSGGAQLLQLRHPALASHAGDFWLDGDKVSFVASRQGRVSLQGRPVQRVEMKPDSTDDPTVLATGSLQFLVIERAGRYGIRVRDLDSERRRTFSGLQYFPVGEDWVIDARFEPYDPVHVIPIMNILGMEVPMTSPGAVIFSREGKEWRLDALLEDPDGDELFIMFTDGTSGRETYGGGRFLYSSMPKDGHIRVDFNRAYNPPCAFNTFATCPLPPDQNRLALRVSAGELKYTHKTP